MFLPVLPLLIDRPAMNIIEPTKQQLDDLVNPFLAHANVGFAIGYASPQFQETGKFYFKNSSPLLNQNNQEVPFGVETYFEIASISKVFTATLFQLFVQNGTIANNEIPLGDYFPRGKIGLGEQFLDIPLLALSNYTSGLPQDNDSAPDEPAYLPMPYTVLNMFSYLANTDLTVNTPGTAYTYSNLGFAILAQTASVAAVERIGEFGELLRSEILGPLAMDATKLFYQVGFNRLPLGYSSHGPKGAPNAPGMAEFPAYYGAGGLLSTPRDMMVWLKFNMGIIQNSTLSSLLPTLQAPSTTVTPWANSQLGIGWFLSTVPTSGDSYTIVWKDGGLGGFSSYICFLQSANPGQTPSQAGFFILTNADGNAVYTIESELMSIMTGNSELAASMRLLSTRKSTK